VKGKDTKAAQDNKEGTKKGSKKEAAAKAA